MQRKLAKLDNLKELGLADMCIRHAIEGKDIHDSLPLVEDVDLSRNLFPDLDAIGQLCQELKNLRILRLNYNRIASPMKLDKLKGETFANVNIIHILW